MTFQDTSNRYPMGPQEQPPDFAWIDQFAQELLLTVQAFQRLQAVFQSRFIDRAG